jgi:hypothetical protein
VIRERQRCQVGRKDQGDATLWVLKVEKQCHGPRNVGSLYLEKARNRFFLGVSKKENR